MDSREVIVHVNGIAVCYDDLGEGKLPVIFIHGFPFNKSMWRNQAEHLKDLTRVITYDLRGYGQSDEGNEEITISLFADDLVKLMDILLIERAIICGLSMGGYIALNALYRYRGRFEGIILCDTQCGEDTPEAKTKRYENIKLIEENGLDTFSDNLIKNLFTEETLKKNSKIVNEVKKIITGSSRNVIKSTLKALAERWEMCSSLNEIKIPALILCGKEDKLTPPHLSELMHKNIYGSHLFLIDKTAHLSNLEQSIIFNNRLTHFIASILPIEKAQ